MEVKKYAIIGVIVAGILVALIAISLWLWAGSDGSDGSPGLSFRPIPKDKSTLIWIKSYDNSYKTWVDNMSDFLEEYLTVSKVPGKNEMIQICSFHEYPQGNKYCDVDVRQFGECSRENFFGYHRDTPCIFLMLDKIHGWAPVYYDNPDELPDEMPTQLKEHIRSLEPSMRKSVWLSCRGENSADIEYLGPITYHAQVQGFPGYYFPYLNTKSYLSPLVAVKFERPHTGIVLNVECRAWAKNINSTKANRQGSVTFQLLLG